MNRIYNINLRIIKLQSLESSIRIEIGNWRQEIRCFEAYGI